MESPFPKTTQAACHWALQIGLFLMCAFGWECCSVVARAESSTQEVRVLFIGNSLTLRQDMPFLLEQIARGKGKRLVADYSPSRDGYKLQMHANSPRTLEAIRSKPWDYVVLQEHGLRPLLKPAATKSAVATLHESIRAAGARTILYEHSRSGDTNGMALADRQRPLSIVFQQVATELNLPLAPVGPAFVEACRRDPAVRLFEEDHFHPAPEGAYLAACVMYATIFNETPEGTIGQRLLSPRGTLVIDLKRIGEKSKRLQQAAWSVVQNRQNRILPPGDTQEGRTNRSAGPAR